MTHKGARTNAAAVLAIFGAVLLVAAAAIYIKASANLPDAIAYLKSAKCGSPGVDSEACFSEKVGSVTRVHQVPAAGSSDPDLANCHLDILFDDGSAEVFDVGCYARDEFAEGSRLTGHFWRSRLVELVGSQGTVAFQNDPMSGTFLGVAGAIVLLVLGLLGLGGATLLQLLPSNRAQQP
jgi:hypothetical protein